MHVLSPGERELKGDGLDSMKLKLSRTTQWILIIGILVALLLSAGIVYARQQARHDDLSEELAQAQQDFDRYTQQKEDLQDRLRQAQAELLLQKEQFPASAEALEIQQDLLAAADFGQVTITSLSFSTPTAVASGGQTYQVYSVGLTVAGEIGALFNFIEILGGWFPSAAIGSVTLTTSAGGGAASMTLPLSIYTMGG
jgi:type II secretory pathway pseudopilin PulG